MSIFDRIVRMIDRTEVSVITVVAKIIPIIIPIIPAQIGYKNVTNNVYGLGWDPLLGWSYALVIEGLGYSAIYIGMRFWEHNRKVENVNDKAPLFGVVVVYVIYLIVTLFVNALLDYKANIEIYKVVATAMVSLLSVPGGLLMGISAIHTERTIAREQEAQDKANERKEANERRRQERQAERERQANEHRTPNDEQPSERTPKNRRPERTNTPRTNVPQPQMNERAANEQGEQGQPLGFPTNGSKGEQIMQYIERIEASENRTPGQSEIARNVGVSKSTADAVLKKIR